jgi:hypothetical protein
VAANEGRRKLERCLHQQGGPIASNKPCDGRDSRRSECHSRFVGQLVVPQRESLSLPLELARETGLFKSATSCGRVRLCSSECRKSGVVQAADSLPCCRAEPVRAKPSYPTRQPSAFSSPALLQTQLQVRREVCERGTFGFFRTRGQDRRCGLNVVWRQKLHRRRDGRQ